jgi:hypothetical protein
MTAGPPESSLRMGFLGPHLAMTSHGEWNEGAHDFWV